MPPVIALVVALAAIGYLLWREWNEEPRTSAATWIPTLWLLINGSRQVSVWLGHGSSFAAQRLEEGSAVDKAVYGGLILAAVGVLASRVSRPGAMVRGNLPLVVLLLYAGVSVLWSDFPAVAFKRWVKTLGDALMVLVLWSEAQPARAIGAVIRRCAYVLVPLSVLFCKYYENLGVNYDEWGRRFYTGVATDKNMLGYVLFVTGLFLVARLLGPRGEPMAKENRPTDRAIDVALLVMIGWLFVVTDCKTALFALICGAGVVVASRASLVRTHFVSCAAVAVVLGIVLELAFSLSGFLMEGAGRDATLTGRTGLWETLLGEPINPLVGVGYGSFWLGERLARYWAMYPTSPPIQAHNGYLEVYINIGLIGLTLVAVLLLNGLATVRARIVNLVPDMAAHDRVLATFGLAYVSAYLLYNVTEATFQGLNFLFTIFLILAFSPAVLPLGGVARRQRSRVQPAHSPAARRADRRPLNVT